MGRLNGRVARLERALRPSGGCPDHALDIRHFVLQPGEPEPDPAPEPCPRCGEPADLHVIVHQVVEARRDRQGGRR